MVKNKYYATNVCGAINSNEVAITVEDVLAAPTIVDYSTQTALLNWKCSFKWITSNMDFSKK
jgi:hypothetical protein